jgi:stage II sporulation protein AB (anti-sigma F factor)
MNNRSEMVLEFSSTSQNESFARVVCAAFISRTNPTIEEVSDVKTAVSEAVTNAIIHGYENQDGIIRMKVVVEGRQVYIEIQDEGKGIADVERTMEPLFTTRPDMDRSGMGFSFMEAFMDGLKVESAPGKGTLVKMRKEIGAGHHFE